MDFQDAPIVSTPIDDGFKVAFVGAVHTNTAWIENELKRIVLAKPKRIDLDLSACNFLSSSGIGVLMAFYNGIKSGGGMINIVAIQKPVLGTLRYSRLDALFKFSPDAILPAKG